MTTFQFTAVFIGGLVVGVIHHAYLQPKITKAWGKIKAAVGRIGTRKDAE